MRQYKQNSNKARELIILLTIGFLVFNIVNVIITIAKH